MPLVTTLSFIVNGTDNDPRGIDITDYLNFNHGSYDFKIDLKFAGYDIIEDWTDASTDGDLSNVQLELASEDVLQELSVWNAWRSEVVDNDLDSYYSSVVITIDIDVDPGDADVYLRIGYKPSAESIYTFFNPTDPFYISGNSRDDDKSYIFSNFGHGQYDFRFEVLIVDNDIVQVIYDDTDEPDLNDVRLETNAEDGLP